MILVTFLQSVAVAWRGQINAAFYADPDIELHVHNQASNIMVLKF